MRQNVRYNEKCKTDGKFNNNVAVAKKLNNYVYLASFKLKIIITIAILRVSDMIKSFWHEQCAIPY